MGFFQLQIEMELSGGENLLESEINRGIGRVSQETGEDRR